VRLFGKGLGDQAGWTIPFALFGLFALAGLLWRARRPKAQDAAEAQDSAPPAATRAWRRDPRLATLLVLGGWFLVETIVLSMSKGIVHPYYVSALGPATGAMTGAGAMALFELRREGGPVLGMVLAALAMVGTVVVQTILLHREHYLLWLVPVLVAGGAVGLLALAAARPLLAPALALMLGLALVAPTAYSATTSEAPVEGTFPAAGPKAASGEGGYGVNARTIQVDRAMVDYALAHRPGRRWTLLVVASDTAAPLVLMGYDVAAVGGYSGTDPALTGGGLANLVRTGQARYVVLGGVYSTRGGNLATQATLRACRQMRPSEWHSPDPYTNGLVLFDCAGRERALAAR
jgi:4-amino-4-deoxy-L-arabinose transferase-like glycosyltransferase